MKEHFELIIVVPVYNEAERINLESFKRFLREESKTGFCFIDDGSTDGTACMLHSIKKLLPERVTILSLAKNRGKAGAVYHGMAHCLSGFSFDKIAYLDADLATSLEECKEIARHINVTTEFAFGSRIAKLDSVINRKRHRFLMGRFLATIISNQLRLKVYDTQCGCKVFSQNLARMVFDTGFISSWLFDVEIFHRLLHIYGKERLIRATKEVPLKNWIDKGASKVRFWYLFRIGFDLRRIKKAYSRPGGSQNIKLTNGKIIIGREK